MDTKYQITENSTLKLCTYEWLSLVTVTATVMALGAVAWFALDTEVEQIPSPEEFVSFPVVEK